MIGDTRRYIHVFEDERLVHILFLIIAEKRELATVKLFGYRGRP